MLNRGVVQNVRENFETGSTEHAAFVDDMLHIAAYAQHGGWGGLKRFWRLWDRVHGICCRCWHVAHARLCWTHSRLWHTVHGTRCRCWHVAHARLCSTEVVVWADNVLGELKTGSTDAPTRRVPQVSNPKGARLVDELWFLRSCPHAPMPHVPMPQCPMSPPPSPLSVTPERCEDVMKCGSCARATRAPMPQCPHVPAPLSPKCQTLKVWGVSKCLMFKWSRIPCSSEPTIKL